MMNKKKDITVLIPTYNRLKALAVTLTSLCFQTEKSFNVIISDQSFNETIYEDQSLQAVLRLLDLHGHAVSVKKIHHHREWLNNASSC